MSYLVKTLLPFERAAKTLIKKYPSLAGELRQLRQTLANEPTTGKSLGRNCYKVRLAIENKGKGRSGGARVITYVAVVQQEVVLLTIFDKNEREDLGPNELKGLLSSLE